MAGFVAGPAIMGSSILHGEDQSGFILRRIRDGSKIFIHIFLKQQISAHCHYNQFIADGKYGLIKLVAGAQVPRVGNQYMLNINFSMAIKSLENFIHMIAHVLGVLNPSADFTG